MMNRPHEAKSGWKYGILSLAAVLTLSTAPTTTQAREDLPECREASTPYMTMAIAGKDFFAPYNGTPDGDYFAVFGLKNLTKPREMVMGSKGTLYHSPDEGCTWNEFYTVGNGQQWPLSITTAPQGHAYAFTINYNTLLALTNTQGGMEATTLKSPAANIMGVGVDSQNPLHVRVADDNGTLYDSTDGGQLWQRIGVLPNNGSNAVRMTFDPADLDHVLYLTHREGAFVTFDGGDTWTQSTGLSSSNGPRNAFNAVVSPIDSRLVWCMSLDLNESDQGHPSRGRHIYASLDGGLTFTPRVDDGNGVVITNGPELTAHPTDLRKIAWVASKRFTGLDVYELNGLTGVVKQSHNDNLAGRSVEYYIRNPRLMYIGLETKF